MSKPASQSASTARDSTTYRLIAPCGYEISTKEHGKRAILSRLHTKKCPTCRDASTVKSTYTLNADQANFFHGAQIAHDMFASEAGSLVTILTSKPLGVCFGKPV
jgi:hypothetical protein